MADKQPEALRRSIVQMADMYADRMANAHLERVYGTSPSYAEKCSALASEARAELHGALAAKDALIAELVGALGLYLEWCDAEDDHSKTEFSQRVEMCRTSEAAARTALAKAKEAQ